MQEQQDNNFNNNADLESIDSTSVNFYEQGDFYSNELNKQSPPLPAPLNNTTIKQKKITTRLLAQIGILIATLIVGAQLGFPIPFSLISVTLATMFVMLIAMLLKPVPALVAISIYVAMGSMGLPIFSQFQNFSVYFAPSGGFVIGFIPATFLTSFLIGLLEKRFPTSNGYNKTLIAAKNFKRNTVLKYIYLLLILLAFTVVLFTIGTLWFQFVFMRSFSANPANISFWQALLGVTIPFLPGEAIKIALVMMVYKPLVRFRS